MALSLYAKSKTNGMTPVSANHYRQRRWQQLLHPPPTSMVLSAAVRLLPDFIEGQTVYLMDRDYLANWLAWALHQNVPVNEASRLREAVRMAALKLKLPLPAQGTEYTDPGPMENSSLSLQGHPMILNLLVTVNTTPDEPTTTINNTSNGGRASAHHIQHLAPPTAKHRSNSLSNVMVNNNVNGNYGSGNNNELDKSMNAASQETAPAPIPCLAVPEGFYETLRATHGVVCEDFVTVSFQKTSVISEQQNVLLHHHHHQHQYHHENNNSMRSNGNSTSPRPIEFRRKVIRQKMDRKKMDNYGSSDHPPESLMEKLMLEEPLIAASFQLVVEVHPIKLVYSLATKREEMRINGNNSKQQQGFVLVSTDTPAVDAVMALQSTAEPSKASTSKRIWSRWNYGKNNKQTLQSPTAVSSNGYELVDIDALQDVTVGDWVMQHVGSGSAGSVKELEVMVEIRKTVNSDWPLQHLELANRLQPGDFVDAQDVAGKWYESVIRQVLNDDYVLVHYAGWASRWDSKAPRRRKQLPQAAADDSSTTSSAAAASPNKAQKVKAPAPLWSQSGRWREQLCVSDMIEVRDSSSIVERPRWYRGKVVAIGKPNDKPRELVGGADLETYPVSLSNANADDEVERKPLLVLHRTQQILVEVDSEKSDKASILSASSSSSSPVTKTSVSTITTCESLKPHPPHLRWVNLYGEEICQLGTHLKPEPPASGPVTLRYEFDSHRKPVEVMKSQHPMLGSGFMRESLRGTPPAPGSVGLHNLGNSCFLNSTVQCLNHIEPLTQFFLQDKYSKDLNKQNPLGSGGNVAVAYASLLKKMWAGNHSVLVPRLLKQTVASFAPQFDNSYQHDSHEFCQFLMDGLHEDLNRCKTKPYVEELEGFGMEDQRAAIESWRKHLLRHDSVIVDYCQGMHRSHLTCPQCGRESIKFDVYSSISLPLPLEKENKIIKLEDCIEKFMEAEQLDERDAYYCPSCRRHVCALKLIALWSVPDILIIHLKRFTFDTCMLSGSMLRSKIDNTVEFPINGLDLTKEVLGPIDPEAPPIYNLFGVSEHIGPTANSGHYTATVRNSIDGQWYRCNDSHVGRTSGEASITGGAYLLFYQRAKGASKWGGMHKVMKERGIDPYGGLDPTDEEGFTPVKNKKKKKG